MASPKAPAAAAGPRYVYPVPGLGISRTDQGKDFYGNGNLLALGDARILRTTTWGGGWGPGGLVYQLLNGPKAGTKVYWQENLRPTVRPGQVVRAGEVIAKVTGPIEGGWSNPEGTNALARPRYTEGKVMPEGVDFWNFLQGVKKGNPGGSNIATGTVNAKDQIPSPGDLLGTGADAAAGAAGDAAAATAGAIVKLLVGAVGDQSARMLLYIVFVGGAMTLVALGVSRAAGLRGPTVDQLVQVGELAATRGASAGKSTTAAKGAR